MSRLVGLPRSVTTRLSELEALLAINTLRDIIDAGWSYMQYGHGVGDEFADQAGVATNTGGTYDAAGKYYHNPVAYTADLSSAAQEIHGDPNNGYSYPNAYAWDNDTGTTAWMSTSVTSGIGGTAWWGQDFGSGNAKHIRRVTTQYYVSGAGPDTHRIASVALDYSDDGATWTQAHTFSIGTGLTKTTVDIPATAAHRYWRLRNLATTTYGPGSWGGQLPETEMMESLGVPDMTLTSIGFSAGVTPVAGRVVIVGSFGASSFGLSRDNGVTWPAYTEGVYLGSLGNGLVAYSRTFDLSASPSGSTMKWRFDATAGYTSQLHGVWLQWRE